MVGESCSRFKCLRWIRDKAAALTQERKCPSVLRLSCPLVWVIDPNCLWSPKVTGNLRGLRSQGDAAERLFPLGGWAGEGAEFMN